MYVVPVPFSPLSKLIDHHGKRRMKVHLAGLFLLALQLAGGAALLAGAARPPLERRALRGSRAAVVCGLFDAMGGADSMVKVP